MRPKFIVPVLVLITGALVLAGGRAGWKTAAKQQAPKPMTVQEVMAVQSEVTTTNSTKNLTVLRAERKNGYVDLTLRNDYDKPISAFVISPGHYSMLEDLAGFKPIAPGETRVEQVLTPNPVIAVNAAIFNDLTGDGDPKFVEEVVERHRGELVQRLRIHRLLKALADAPDSDLETGLQAIRARIAALPETAVAQAVATPGNPWFCEGLRDAKNSELMELDMRDSAQTEFHRADLTRLALLRYIERNKGAITDINAKETPQ
jgi:hypothetical protein